MYNKIIKVLFIALVVAILSYLFYYNPHSVDLKFGKEQIYSMPLALLIVVSFFVGVFALGMSILFLGLQMKYSLWKSNKEIAEKERHLKELTVARDLLALGNLKESSSLLAKIVARDPHNLIARVFLSEVSIEDNSIDQAINILEKARAEERNSPSLLLKLADYYTKKGNLSAAYDNLALALKENPKSVPLLQKAVSTSRDLKKFTVARSHIDTLLKVCPYGKQAEIQNLLAEVTLEEAAEEKTIDFNGYKDKLIQITKDFKNYAPALLELANTQIKSGDTDQAVKTLKKVLAKNHSKAALESLVNFWLENKNPAEAIALLRTTLDSNMKELEIPAEALLLQVLIHLESTEEARDLLAKMKEKIRFNPGIESLLIALQAKLEAKTPGRSSTNMSLEKLIIKEATTLKLPTIPPKVLHPNLSRDQLEILGYESSTPII